MPALRKCLGSVFAWLGALLFPAGLFLAVVVPAGPIVLQAPAIVLALLMPMPLLRRAPIPALLLFLVGGTAVLLAVHNEAFVLALAIVLAVTADIMAGKVAATRSRRVSIPAAVVVAAAELLLLFVINQPGTGLTVATALFLAVITAWVIGNSVRQRRQYAAAQRDQAEARAVQAERLRIARELHDMIAHSIGVIAVQAGMGRRVIDTQPAEARAALANIEDTGRETAAALRRMLGTLRRTDAQAAPASREPAPGLDDLEGLVARTAQAGVRVDLRRLGERTALPPDIDLSAFRIVQEAVTNVIRHAGTGHCDVAVREDAGVLTIEVTDDGRGGTGLGAGYGIPGMRERVSLLGGDFAAGPRDGGGFGVTATIPLPATGPATLRAAEMPAW
ncbi:sensor histidine kinase [Actinoplanes sp. L3-i22]|uniref:sensor histidine kinase n=1 Tax=Actinoplanes sp. L3-i22 TaxID=2836373 RepID=UPI001C8577B4|nr:histidine kinase [Actinoplanes sp. L3-i22]